MRQVDAIVAGAGIWGCVVARVLAENGRKVLVLEKRQHVGGNVRCETDPDTGIEVHTYGSHIFHTHIGRVWDFVRRFVEFNGYQHKVLARHAGKTYFLPLGLTLVNQFYGLDLTPAELPAFIAAEAGRGTRPRVPANFEEQAISFIGKPLYDAFIREYTRKQWGTDPRNLSADIIKRLPVRASYDVNYFPDYRQGIPLTGYNSLFDRMLDHPDISVECNVDWLSWRHQASGAKHQAPVFYSGPIDALFGYKFGPLPWRSLRFERERVPVADFQGTSVVNYTDADVAFTRIHEFKHYHPEDAAVMSAPSTVICREYPQTWKPGDEPYYPVDTPESRERLALYQAEAEKVPNLVVGGRLGEYKYYDIDRSIDRALETAFRHCGA
ncbi:MAG: UDP-galactopyranose mutase [Kiritimatiellae bacterium]|nr:UDP-galactopyranose mutase [Kiritimatiellia bacterium]